MGSTSDWDTLKHAADMLERLGVPHEVRVVSAHRTPDLLFEYAGSARDRGLKVIIAGAGGAAHLPGMCAAKTSLPVLGVPVQSKTLNGLDSLLSIVQMPAGIPVATLAIGVAGATNAALLAASILGNEDTQDPRGCRRVPRRADRQGPRPARPAQPDDLHMKIGVIGAGQLGRMLALAGYPLAQQFLFLDTSADAPGAQVAPIITGAFDDPHSLERLAAEVDLVTYEFENVPVEALHRVAATRPVWPPVEALRVSQDRLLEKQLFTQLRIPTPPFRAVDSLADLRAAVKELGLPCVLKTRRLGYDGKGQRFLRKPADLEPAWHALGSAPLILEGFVDFEREVSIVGVRSTTGEVRAYPIVANTHKDGILRVTLAPHRHPVLQKAAEIHLKRVLRHFDYAGVLTIEFFVRKGKLVANEMAPARAQLRALDDRRRRHLAVREPRARDPRPAARRDQRRRASARWSTSSARCPTATRSWRCPACTGTTTARSRGPAARSAIARSWRASAVERDRLVRKVLRKVPPR